MVNSAFQVGKALRANVFLTSYATVGLSYLAIQESGSPQDVKILKNIAVFRLREDFREDYDEIVGGQGKQAVQGQIAKVKGELEEIKMERKRKAVKPLKEKVKQATKAVKEKKKTAASF